MRNNGRRALRRRWGKLQGWFCRHLLFGRFLHYSRGNNHRPYIPGASIPSNALSAGPGPGRPGLLRTRDFRPGYGSRTGPDQLGQRLPYPPNTPGPVSSLLLPEDSHHRIPWCVLAANEPARAGLPREARASRPERRGRQPLLKAVCRTAAGCTD
jgi:hypothetical protein